MSEDDFMDFISQEEMDEILAIEAELGVDIDLDEILSEVDNDDDDDLELG
jgi:hypothetical protein